MDHRGHHRVLREHGRAGSIGDSPAAAIIELVGGILLILGLRTKIVAALVAIGMLGAFAIAHAPNGIFVSEGGWELVGIIFAAALMLIAAGPGMHSVDQFTTKSRQSR